MATVFVLASSLHEAAQIARLAGLRGPHGWDLFGRYSTLGLRGNAVLVTSMHCWRRTRNAEEAGALGYILASQGFKVIPVPCPEEWVPGGFRLPAGWAEPLVPEPKVVLHPPMPSFWRRIRRAMVRS